MNGQRSSTPCAYFQRGYCRHGTACRFAHNQATTFTPASPLPFADRQYVQSQASLASLKHAGGAAFRFRVMTYNVLADCLAREHAAELYRSAPSFSLDWSYRGELIIREVLHHSPDVVCLQEVDHFPQFKQALQRHGYEGIYTSRTGDRQDGLATFWRTERLRMVQQQIVKFSDHGMKDNVAQLLTLEPCTDSGAHGSTSSTAAASGSHASRPGSNSSLPAQSGRQPASPAKLSRHLRFDSGSEGEGEDSGSFADQRSTAAQADNKSSTPAVGATAAAIDQASLSLNEGVAAMQLDSVRAGGVVDEVVEEAAGSVYAAEASSAEAAASGRPPPLVVAQTHCLFNPKRGDIKLGQVRTLLEHVNSLCLQQQKRRGQRAAAIVAGDFNSAAGSPIYDFVRDGSLLLLDHDRRYLSGQVESRGNSWRDLQQACLAQQRQQRRQSQQQHHHLLTAPASSLPKQPPAVLLGSSAAAATYAASSGGGSLRVQHQQVQVQQQVQLSPPYAPAPEHPVWRSGSGSFRRTGSSGLRAQRPWCAEDVSMAAGTRGGGGGQAPVARHPLQLESTYRAVTGSECPYSTCHDKFIGAVDYIWSSREDAGSAWQLLPVGVLLPPPLETLSCALPSPAWPSDHVSLVTDFAYLPHSPPVHL